MDMCVVMDRIDSAIDDEWEKRNIKDVGIARINTMAPIKYAQWKKHTTALNKGGHIHIHQHRRRKDKGGVAVIVEVATGALIE